MGYLVRMPQMGMSMEQGTVVEWTTDEGGDVAEGETVVVVESEKAEADVEARETGVLRRILVEAGDVVEPGAPIGIVAGPDEDVDALLEEASAGTPSAEDVEADGVTAADTGSDEPAGDAAAPSASSDEDVRATPGARQAAEDASVDLATVEGSGPGGAITEDDVEAATGGETAEAEPAAAGERGPDVRERRPLSGIQQTISERLSTSYRNAVHVTLRREIETGALESKVAEAGSQGPDVSYNDFLLKAAGDALVDHPAFNAHFVDGEHVLYEDVHVGLAVDTGGSLLTPVIEDVDDRDAAEVNEARTELTERVVAGDYTMDDLRGGTFTVSNLGAFGVDSFDPIIDPPQVAILGVGRVRDDGTMALSLSFDHRVVNGADAARFLDSIATRLADDSTLAGYLP